MRITRRDALRGGTATVAAIAGAGAVTAGAAVDEPVMPLVEELKSINEVWMATNDAFDAAVYDAGLKYPCGLQADWDLITVKTPKYQAYWSRREIQQAVEFGNLTAEERDHYFAEIDAMQARAAEIRREHGLEQLAQDKVAYRGNYFETRQQIVDTPANSIVGILAKFRAFYSPAEEAALLAGEGLTDDLDNHFSGSIYRDLLRLAGEVQS